jgi:TolB-like protein
MLAGEPPYTGPSAQVIAAKMMTGDIPSVRRTRPAVPVAVDAAIRKALSPVPADRFATTADFARSLEAGAASVSVPARGPGIPALAIIGAGIVLLAAGTYAWRSRAPAVAAATGPAPAVRLAVLPFDNLGDSADAYFADGMTDAVRAKLTAVSGLEVIAPTSSGEYRHSTKPLAEIGRELGARYLVIGKVRWSKTAGRPSHVEVRPALVEAATTADRWEHSFEAPLQDVFRVQEQIADEVASELQLTLTPAAQKTLAARPTENLAAYDAYLRGVAIGRRGDGAVVQHGAAVAFREAVQLDSTFAEAWAHLALAQVYTYTNGIPNPALGDSARSAAARAIALAPGLPAAHAALASYDEFVRDDLAGALAERTVALALGPSDVQQLSLIANTEQSLGYWDAALGHYQEAAQLDPRAGGVARALAGAELRLRNYPAAREAADRSLALHSANPEGVEGRIMVALAEGNLHEARAALRAGFATVDTAVLVAYVAAYWDLGWVFDTAEERVLFGLGPGAFDDDKASWGIVLAQQHALRGDTTLARAFADTARAAFEAHLERAPNDPQLHVFLGLALAYLGRRADAVREGLRGVQIEPIARDAVYGPYYQHQLARIYTLVGEPEKAIDALEPLLRVPYYLSPGWLRIDPDFAPLRGNPRFERLLAQPATGERPIA